MATKITIIKDGDLVEGAAVIVGGIVGEALTTNDRGNISFAVDADWQGYVDVKITISGTIATSTVHIIEGDTHIIDLGESP